MENFENLKSSLARIINDGLSIRYTGKSSVEEIPTNNLYQSIKLGENIIGGFRSYRKELFSKYFFNKKVIFDIGANLGENSRLASERGASIVFSLEYDELFSMLSSLICAYNKNAKVLSINADATKFDFTDYKFDVALIFSVWPYVSERIADLRKSEAKVLILETHNIGDIKKINEYLNTILPHYPYYSIVDCVDWGKNLDGLRYVINFSKTWADLEDIFCLDRKWMDYSKLFGFFNIQELQKITAFPDHSESVPTAGVGDRLYWQKFLTGVSQYNERGYVEENNIYFLELKYQLASSKFDDALISKLDTLEKIKERVARRFIDFCKIQNGVKVDPVRIYLPKDKIGIATTARDIDPDWTRYSANYHLCIDGYHRLFSYAFHGVHEIPTSLYFHPQEITN